MESLLEIWTIILLWTIAFSIIFPILGHFMPCNPGQKLWRKDAITDLIYCFLLPVTNRIVMIGFLAAGAHLFFYGQPFEDTMAYLKNGYGPISTLPVWFQICLFFVITDFIFYWTHRLFHSGSLWKWHAIHHSAKHVDWLSTYRFHPVNTWLTFSVVDACMILIGFAPAISAALAGVNAVYSAMVHANLNWTFGPFKYLFASPVFHRWHHTTQKEGLDKNFAPTFPIYDVMFGTFYMPDHLPEKYGVLDSDIPDGIVGQIMWPFKQAK